MSVTHPKTSPVSFSKFVGIPYEKKNCWDLVQYFYLDVFGIELKQYYETEPKDRPEIKNLIHSNIGDFSKLEGQSPKLGDIVLLKIYGLESHIGVCLGEGLFLHTTKGVGSCLDRLERWAKVTVGFYTHTAKVR